MNEARRLARKGHYAEAARQLSEVLDAGACTEIEALDLLARIYAQQGMLLLAESCWRKAQALEPSNPAYADALASLRRCQRPLAGRLFAAGCAALAVVLLAASVLLAAMHRDECRHRQKLNGQIADLRKHLDATLAGQGEAISRLAQVLAAQGAVLAADEKEWKFRQRGGWGRNVGTGE